MTVSHFQTCYISPPLTVDTTPLRLALQERGICWSDALTAKPKGSTLDTIESAIALYNIHSLTDFKRNTSAYVEKMKETKAPLVLTVNGEAELVVQSAKAYH